MALDKICVFSCLIKKCQLQKHNTSVGTPSPRKKRNNSTPTRKNAAEKKQILQQLVAPPGNQNLSRKVSLGELIQLSERNIIERNGHKHAAAASAEPQIKETRVGSEAPPQAMLTLSDPKLEKKVTFARLLNKVSAEMSSGSDMEMGVLQSSRLGLAFARPSSTPPSPADLRSPHSTSSNQGSDTFSSSELAIPSAVSSSFADFMGVRSHKLSNGRQKPASADSILAMFRSYSSSNASFKCSSLKVSPSTTPTGTRTQNPGPRQKCILYIFSVKSARRCGRRRRFLHIVHPHADIVLERNHGKSRDEPQMPGYHRDTCPRAPQRIQVVAQLRQQLTPAPHHTSGNTQHNQQVPFAHQGDADASSISHALSRRHTHHAPQHRFFFHQRHQH